ncbi:2-hydroxyacid dehydrogenase [Methanocorpusculum vombati]|uniref:2-hydroxyacid dehydrogenase n=1 Tax=Methanocorpusculum vombati TaxID=3002864 RepID=A0ABT4ILA7_9EURY|nr:2-hydroxyacid dehydrogenase [Methanocorpusculum vombati]MCZ9318813.1 2-hydroxyacid dehydrogenase [Methanocorpusculum sp.]MCZ0862550.1 2-hydroxyacid dehydrogenase [Methanocorpusculum vombati]MDE2521455.1 2-hydroxyacid dehydrogenase [Methanocorpusculum sp.]MDE2533941.1 2-hydroxyacid dehydrogenase [Methanocorpusculum sp.]MDE2546871.1 2-hydroxyacid dehydrogenase [Methanocorpusculum sp.]
MHIVLLEPIGVPDTCIQELAADLISAGHRLTCYPTRTTDPQELGRRSRDADIIIIANTPYPAEAIRQADRLKMIAVAFTGIDHIDTAACTSRGITICNAANYANQPVAELSIGLTIALLRSISAADTAARTGNTSAAFTGREIAGRTVGIIGTGRIGLAAARLFSAFGAKILAFSRSESEAAHALGITYVPLDTLLWESDIISLHVPATPETHHLINAERLALMKPSAILINCARGSVVDNAALARALTKGTIAGAGIDVFDTEPPLPQDYPLLAAPNTILTPHIGFLSEESMRRRAEIVFQNITAYLSGSPENVCRR